MSHRGSAWIGLGVLALSGLAWGCDPQEPPPVWENGPPFLIVAPSTEAVDSGIALYLQSRGGNWVAISTDGCTHSLGEFAGVTQSCGQVPYSSASPLLFTVDPEDRGCVVHASLYSVCDCDAGLPGDFSSGHSYYVWCDTTGTLVASQILSVGGGVPPVEDAAVESGDAADGGGT
jgi:hypothetical protein